MRLSAFGRELQRLLVRQPFVAAVISLSTFLQGYGVTLRAISPRTAVGESQHVRLSMFEDGGLLFVSVAPRISLDGLRGDPLAMARALSDAELPLLGIAHALRPDMQFAGRYFRSEEAARAEIERQLRLLVELCSPFLNGDFSAWPALTDSVRRIYGPVGGESMRDWVIRARQALLTAVSEARYTLAVDLCEQLAVAGVRLTREERTACRAAAREVERLRRR